ncbi:MAG: PQQ-binding-like beta-propeller repeat protein [Caldilineaceae bacterium]
MYVAASDGRVTALKAADGEVVWQIDVGAPVLTSPSLSEDGATVFLGTEDIEAVAVRATDGAPVWRTPLQGQSLAERYPVVLGNGVYYRSQPVDFFHTLLSQGSAVMNAAGPLLPDWDADWKKSALVRDQITRVPHRQPHQTDILRP